ncbi:hypothetical protein [Pontibacillus marinus]|uniref:Gas vesicle protein n=1 Tax=Pontibacillus marinus BH030004 = DSM 16465 TaxID=1385511 RepID=A0A0A5GE70_9BACI|nr:hypothetical protein [Pontibacillus marinus]KGX90319.1 hypothetical protein N783_21245 [Pontibacillus marinus BH030004 = DSM 16465]
MGESKMLKGLAIGAFAGMALSLIDGPTRKKTVHCLKQSGSHAKGYAKNPSHAIEDLRIKYEQWSYTLDSQIKNVLDMLDQMEGYLSKVEQADEEPPKQLEGPPKQLQG